MHVNILTATIKNCCHNNNNNYCDGRVRCKLSLIKLWIITAKTRSKSPFSSSCCSRFWPGSHAHDAICLRHISRQAGSVCMCVCVGVGAAEGQLFVFYRTFAKMNTLTHSHTHLHTRSGTFVNLIKSQNSAEISQRVPRKRQVRKGPNLSALQKINELELNLGRSFKLWLSNNN